MSDDSPLQRLAISTSDGIDLRAELVEPDTTRAVAVVCHPHPLHGGSMYANVVAALFRSLPHSGVAVVRFNFRGTSGSGGRHDHGVGEQLDVAAALDLAADRLPGTPLLLAGYSFGADVSLAVSHEAVTARLAVAPPLQAVAIGDMVGLTEPLPLRIVAAVHDQFQPIGRLATLAAEAPNAELVRVEGTDHFFAVGLDRIEAAALDALDAA